ncbi:MAG: HAD hydrolase family protein [Candidatus Sungbacteria bacterium]|uniref:HAD hydrolase family protein n=1 Tax=Candidatus Sungiibacteriota bacterium TaxID=2750080 RepID=A0A932YXZ2_9BACT|nr:HAD hydrolase family protein [Candidatus Sungbacteria bacterium]MBI4132321.1 HAD hydrolase family protein [Candidatus Sungbacteria bacterium]
MLPQELHNRAEKIKAVALDGDGVFFTGRAFIHPEHGEYLKERSHIDGQGISLLRACGLRVALVSGEATGFLEAAGKKLNALPSVRDGRWPPVAVFTGPQGKDKVVAIGRWLEELGVSWKECAAMGDDVSDFELLKKAGFAAVPRQAEEIVKKIAHYATPREGGNGAIRDLCNLILEAKGIDETTLEFR